MNTDKETKEEIIKGLKENVLFNFIDSTYTESDRFHVSMHEVVDDWASGLWFKDALDFLSQFNQEDFKTLDSGLFEGVFEKEGFEELVTVLAYCLAEQELYNDDFLNKLQNWKSEAEEDSRALIEEAKKELEKVSE